jgi:flagellar basal-body rod protein FlgB
MDFARQPLFAMISQRLGWLNQRQRVLAENIANADTAGYKPHDLKKQTFDQMVRGSASFHMATTSTKHLGLAGQRGSSSNQMDKQKPAETTLSGNAVTLDVELMKIAQTNQDHELATSLYHKQIAMFRNVLGGGGGG